MSPSSGSSTRPRRRGEAREAILEAARGCFATNGFDGTSMREVAVAAGTSEALLYRYFPSKAGLFEEAAVAPYHAFVSDFLDQWEASGADEPNEVVVRRFVEALYAFVREHRRLLFAVIAADRFGTDPGGSALLHQGVKRLSDHTARQAAARHLEHVELDVAVACTIGLVLAMGTLGDLLLGPDGEGPGAERVIEATTRYAAAGIEQRPASS